MPTLTVAGADIHYYESGAGRPLVLVHGSSAEASVWGRFSDELVACGYLVISYDRRGYGASTARPVRNYRRHVDDLAALIEHVGGPVDVFGWSSGGNTALALAAQRPELLRSLVVLEPPWHGLRGANPTMVWAMVKTKALQVTGRPEPAIETFLRWASQTDDGHNAFDGLAPEARATLHRNAKAALAEFDPHPFGVMMEHVSNRRLPTDLAITWLIGGASHAWYVNLARRVERNVPGLRVHTLPGLSHVAHLEDPRGLSAVVAEALSSGTWTDGITQFG